MSLTVTEWQEEFKKMVLLGKWNFFSQTLIKLMLNPVVDDAQYVKKALALLQPYEHLYITMSGLTGQNEIRSPRWLFLELLKIDVTPSINEIRTEIGTPMHAENGEALELEE